MFQLTLTQIAFELGLAEMLGDAIVVVAWTAFVLALIVICSLSTHLLLICAAYLANRERASPRRRS